MASLRKEVKEMNQSSLAPSLEGMNSVRSENGEMLTKPFLDVCKLILPVVERVGAVMCLVKSEILSNILKFFLQRLEKKYSSNPSKYKVLSSMVSEEVEAKTAKASSSCTSGLLLLTRALDFLVELLRNLLHHPDWSMSQACIESYNKTLKMWHGWLASSSFMMALKMVPNRKKVMEIIGGSGNAHADIERFCTDFAPLLEENHKFLANFGVDNLKVFDAESPEEIAVP